MGQSHITASGILGDCQHMLDTLFELETLVQRINAQLTAWNPLTDEDYQVYQEAMLALGDWQLYPGLARTRLQLVLRRHLGGKRT